MHRLKEIDERMYRFALRLSQKGFAYLCMRIFSISGHWGFAWLLLCMAMLFRPQYRQVAWLCLAALLLTTVLVEGVIKRIIRRPRPYITHGPVDIAPPLPRSTSFPSGHTASSMACARILATIDPWVGFAVFVYAALIGFSRIYLRTHYVSDVLAGGVIGLLCAEAARWGFVLMVARGFGWW